MSLLETRVEDGVATVTITNPPLNILTRAVMAELRGTLSRLAADPELRAVCLTAAGRDFSAGADVREHLPPEYRDLIPRGRADDRGGAGVSVAGVRRGA